MKPFFFFQNNKSKTETMLLLCYQQCCRTQNPPKRFELPVKLSCQITHQAVKRQTPIQPSMINRSHLTHERYDDDVVNQSGSRQWSENVRNGNNHSLPVIL